VTAKAMARHGPVLQTFVLITAKCVSFAFLLRTITLSCGGGGGGGPRPFIQESVNSLVSLTMICVT
jgi:hypothetical protein